MIEREKASQELEDALDNEEHDALNEALMNLDAGDLEPLFTGENSVDPFERWQSDAHQQMLRDIGIDLLEDGEELTDPEGS